MRSVTALIMSEIDRRAQEEFNIPASVLMENAGKAVAEDIINHIGAGSGNRIAIFCGKGNNGGDGFVAAWHLARVTDAEISVYLFDPDPAHIKEGPARDNYIRIENILPDSIGSMKYLSGLKGELEHVTVFVDAVFGTGFTGALPDHIGGLWSRVNGLRARRIAVDVPSGLDATTGKVSKGCFRADKTITFGMLKTGQLVNEGRVYCGELVVADIGFPEKLIAEYV